MSAVTILLMDFYCTNMEHTKRLLYRLYIIIQSRKCNYKMESKLPKLFKDSKINQYHGSFIATVCYDTYHNSHFFLHASLADATHLTVNNSTVEVTGKDMEMMLVVGEAAMWTK